MLGHIDRAKGDLGGTQEIVRSLHAVGDAFGDEALVVGQLHVGFVAAWVGAVGVRAGVRVRGGNEDVGRRDAGGFLDQAPGFQREAAVQTEQVADDERELCFAIIEDKAARMKFVVHMSGGEGEEASHDTLAQRWRDVAGGGTGQERSFLRISGRQRGESEDKAEGKKSGKVAHDTHTAVRGCFCRERKKCWGRVVASFHAQDLLNSWFRPRNSLVFGPSTHHSFQP